MRHSRPPTRGTTAETNLGAGLWARCHRPRSARHGHEVLASDLVDYGDPTCFYRRDFLLEHKLPKCCECILTNPPFSLAEEFVEHALELCPHVIMLLRLAFLESERRSRILDTGSLACIHVFRRSLPMMHRDGWTGPKASSAMAFAWFVWDRGHIGPATINRVSASKMPPIPGLEAAR